MKDVLKNIIVGFLSIGAFLLLLEFLTTTVQFVDSYVTNNPEVFPYIFWFIVASVSYFVGWFIRW